MASATAANIKKEVRRILALPYARKLVRNEDGTWHARVLEFPGCMTEGDTQESALTNLDDAMAGWVEIHIEDGDPISHLGKGPVRRRIDP
jgi:antitoxin HicB